MNLRKSFTPTDLTLSEEGAVVVAFSRLNVIDHDGDVTIPGAIPTKDVAMSAYEHATWNGAHPVGRGVIKEVDDLGVFDGRFFMETTQGRDTYHTVKAMAELQEWSYGYQVLPPSGPGVWEGQKVNILKALDIFEVSPVFMGAGIGTATLAIKSGGPGTDLPYAEHLSWVRDEVKAFLDRTDERAEWRAKEGRQLSAANRAALSALLESLRAISGAADELEAFLASNDPEKSRPTRATSLLVEIERARSLGVPI